MKKILSMILCAALILSVLSIVGCGKAEELSLGLGVYTTTSATDATEDKNGSGKAAVTAAAVLVDANGKIVKCSIDCMENKIAYTADGKALATDSFQTKYELGDAYGMTAYGASSEWYKQVDAFTALVAGKTLDEVKALVASTNKGKDEVISAGCTILINEFVMAIEKAVKNAAPSAATAKDTLKLGMSTNQTTTDATEDKPGKNQVETTCVAVATNAEGKITAAMSDCVQVAFTFDVNGASTFANSSIATKRDQGESYGMKAYGGAAKEWFEQASAFDAACIGKTIGEVKSLLGENNYGNTDLQVAGCTILVDGFVKAVSKIG